jgi:segregation and condensation protein B
MSIKAKIEAIIYAAEEPVTLEQIFGLVGEEVRQELARAAEMSAPEPPRPEVPPAPADAPPEAVSLAPAAGAAATPRPITAAEVKSALRAALAELTAAYSAAGHGIEVRQVAGGYRMATKPEQHDLVRAFAKSLKPPLRLTLPALETLAVIAYKQPVTAPEIGEIRGVDAAGVLATLLDRKLITTAGRKPVIGRPILYKTTKEFLLRFGLNDVGELPSVEEFEKLAAESLGSGLLPVASPASPAPAQEAAEPAGADPEAAHRGDTE